MKFFEKKKSAKNSQKKMSNLKKFEQFQKKNVELLTRIFGISKRPATSFEPGGNCRPPGRTHRTGKRSAPSSRHWNTTSKPKRYSISINNFF